MPQGKGRRAGLRAVAAVLALAAAALMGSGPARADGPPLQGAFGKAFTLADEPYPAPDVAFRTRDGSEVTLQDFRGRVVLLNFWATWCAPCVEEMPTLDALEADLKDEGLSVLAISQDRGGLDTVQPFLRDELEVQELGIYLDPKGRLAQAFGLRGMPTTYLIDARGRVVGGMEGPADWNAPEVKALVRHFLQRGRESGVIETGG